MTSLDFLQDFLSAHLFVCFYPMAIRYNLKHYLKVSVNDWWISLVQLGNCFTRI